MPRDKWYMVDVITCAAPELHRCKHMPADYENQIGTRIKKILDVANMQGAEVLILGAWGCGAFRNPEDVVARVFREHLRRYDFKKVVFALGKKDYENSAFYKEFGNLTISIQDAGDVGDMRHNNYQEEFYTHCRCLSHQGILPTSFYALSMESVLSLFLLHSLHDLHQGVLYVKAPRDMTFLGE
jgi:hypothetical protein